MGFIQWNALLVQGVRFFGLVCREAPFVDLSLPEGSGFHSMECFVGSGGPIFRFSL